MLKLPDMSVGLDFDEDTHTYTKGGVVIPSVTQILDPFCNFDNVPVGTLQHAAERGTEIHFAIEKYINYGYESKLNEEYQPYYEQFIDFAKKYGITQENAVSEVIVVSNVFNYAGTIDIIWQKDNKYFLIDVKTASVVSKKIWELQLSGYERAVKEYDIVFGGLFNLQLSPDKYKIIKQESHANEFMSAWLLYSYLKGE